MNTCPDITPLAFSSPCDNWSRLPNQITSIEFGEKVVETLKERSIEEIKMYISQNAFLYTRRGSTLILLSVTDSSDTRGIQIKIA